MRTTVYLPDDLLSKAKQEAAASGRTLTSLIEDGLRQLLANQQKAVSGGPVRLPTYGGQGLQAGVDLDDTSALLDLMEERGTS